MTNSYDCVSREYRLPAWPVSRQRGEGGEGGEGGGVWGCSEGVGGLELHSSPSSNVAALEPWRGTCGRGVAEAQINQSIIYDCDYSCRTGALEIINLSISPRLLEGTAEQRGRSGRWCGKSVSENYVNGVLRGGACTGAR